MLSAPASTPRITLPMRTMSHTRREMAKNRIGNYYVDPLHIRIGINSEDEDGSIGPEVRLKMEIVQKWRGLKCRLEKCRGK